MDPTWDYSSRVHRLGAHYDRIQDRTWFEVWAPKAERVEVIKFQNGENRAVTPFALAPSDDGYFCGNLEGVRPGDRYKFRLNNTNEYPDPASRYQPEGVHGPSEVVDPTGFQWEDNDWCGRRLVDLVIYELHVGTATLEGTFDALIAKLEDIGSVGVTAIEIMPVAAFPGQRNWGYDGADLFAPAYAYGGPEGLRRLVNAAHKQGLAVILDVVFNHLGPEGNYLTQYSDDYFLPEIEYRTNWGQGLNFCGANFEAVREFYVINACYWACEYHIDGLRIDAIQAIRDTTDRHILVEISEAVRRSLPQGRLFVFIAEDDRNDAKVVRSLSAMGWGLDAFWTDDFHHQVRVALFGYQGGYFIDYGGSADDVAKTLQEGWFYNGDIGTKSWWHGKETRELRPWGSTAIDISPPAFVHCIDNHDQAGNRPDGERLSDLVSLEAYRAASALLLLSPYTPMLFMGQEWAASTPFQFFTDYQDRSTKEGVTKGRSREMAIQWGICPRRVPDPQDPQTFTRSKLHWAERYVPPHSGVLNLYRDLLRLRRSLPALLERSRDSFSVKAVHAIAQEKVLALRRDGRRTEDGLLVITNLWGEVNVDLLKEDWLMLPAGYRWSMLLDTESQDYDGCGDRCFSEGTKIRISGPRSLLLKAEIVRDPPIQHVS